MTRTAEETSPRTGLAEMPVVTALTLVVALGALPALSYASEALEFSQPLAMALQWLVLAAVLAVALGVEGLSPPSIGFRRPAWIDLGYLLGTAAVALLIYVATDPLVRALGLPLEAGTSGLEELPSPLVGLAAAITTGVVEELLYRGYAIERLLAFTDSPLTAGGLTWIAFTLVHAVVWPLGNLVQTAAVAALFVVVYLRRRTLVPVVGAHVLIWLLPVLALFAE
ncbi:CPBP family intramembrane glutamic endopeptidase [Halopiger goleimassiliensis]|uniref:CPBP family intramembrane glutamic endopeptidase n=1 Tax=Halopiger goleimassiliensis TaxID=1293048 RepID=UPI00067811A7|nr:CPBP family intramembrane glutamic endopeptidase [Halopiger goleimassiliensis]